MQTMEVMCTAYKKKELSLSTSQITHDMDDHGRYVNGKHTLFDSYAFLNFFYVNCSSICVQCMLARLILCPIKLIFDIM